MLTSFMGEGRHLVMNKDNEFPEIHALDLPHECKVERHALTCLMSVGKHLVMYKDGDVQNAMLRNEAVEWLDKPAPSARSGSPQKARSRASTGGTNPRRRVQPYVQDPAPVKRPLQPPAQAVAAAEWFPGFAPIQSQQVWAVCQACLSWR